MAAYAGGRNRLCGPRAGTVLERRGGRGGPRERAPAAPTGRIARGATTHGEGTGEAPGEAVGQAAAEAILRSLARASRSMRRARSRPMP